jgi:DNA repair photolyase
LGTSRKLLRPADLPDNFTRSLYKVAPYRGCAHACRYCDGRAERYYFKGDYDRDIETRDDAPTLMAIELPGLREQGVVAFGSGTTDPYQPVEERLELTGRCARILAEAKRSVPALVMTKSSLALRDLSSWIRVNERFGFTLLVSLTSLDETLRTTMEPGASSFAARLDMLRAFKTAGCTVGVLAMPFLPGLSDLEDSIRTVYAACADIGVDFVMPGGLTLRPGRQKDCYLATLEASHPDLIPMVHSLYLPEQPSGMPNKRGSSALFARIAAVRRDYSLPFLLPQKIFSRFLPRYDMLRVLYRDMAELYADRGVDIGPLVASARRYDAWLIEIRRYFRKHQLLPNDWLEERLNDAEQSGELGRILDNRKLNNFTLKVLREKAQLNYLSLSLE